MNLEGSGLEELLNEQVKRTSLETARADALQGELAAANLEKVTAQSKVTALKAENSGLQTRVKQAEQCFDAERKVTAALRRKTADLERSLREIRAGVEAAKAAAAQAYFQERSEELVAMGAELLTEGRAAG